MPPQIGILGWGSLLWEGGAEFNKRHDDWRFNGPILKIEFCRVSSSRLRALTLVIDEEYGVEARVAWCLSTRKNVEDAKADLRSREGTTMTNIGCLLMDPEAKHKKYPEKAIADWAKIMKLDAVIWTSLKRNFETEVKRPFSVKEAVAHIRRLPPNGKAKAAEYIWCAPEFVNTPVRDALQREPWFVTVDGA